MRKCSTWLDQSKPEACGRCELESGQEGYLEALEERKEVWGSGGSQSPNLKLAHRNLEIAVGCSSHSEWGHRGQRRCGALNSGDREQDEQREKFI